MRHVAVAWLDLIVVILPLLQLTKLAHFVRRELCQFLGESGLQVGIHAQNLCGADGVAEQLPHDLDVHDWPGAGVRHFAILGSEGILRRVGRRRYEEAIRVFGEEVHVKLCRPAHRRVVLCELFLVPAEEEALPNVLTHPRTAIVGRAPNRALTGSGKAPDIGNDVCDPATRIVVGLCGCLARLDQRLHVVEQRNVTRSEVGGLGKPVVHLDIDVEVVVTIPRRRVFLCPNSLEVCREPAGPAGADEEVAPELEEEC